MNDKTLTKELKIELRVQTTHHFLVPTEDTEGKPMLDLNKYEEKIRFISEVIVNKNQLFRFESDVFDTKTINQDNFNEYLVFLAEQLGKKIKFLNREYKINKE